MLPFLLICCTFGLSALNSFFTGNTAIENLFIIIIIIINIIHNSAFKAQICSAKSHTNSFSFSSVFFTGNSAIENLFIIFNIIINMSRANVFLSGQVQ